jgi:hypothetical protein
MLGGHWACQTVGVVPEHDPVVVYAMVTALIIALAVGIFFASPLRTMLTGPDEDPETSDPQEPPPTHEGPWSTAPPIPDSDWPPSASGDR